jgi:hypothetical protein
MKRQPTSEGNVKQTWAIERRKEESGWKEMTRWEKQGVREKGESSKVLKKKEEEKRK